jgi:ParB-like chromosome segregation protein Spo0J
MTTGTDTIRPRANMMRPQEIIDVGALLNSSCVDSFEQVEQLPEIEVPLNSLVPGFYLRRSGTSAAHVQILADAAATSKLPPILVHKSGLRIIDGLHRFEVARLRGQTHINVRLIDCSDSEALVLAIKSNTLHGLPLSKGDRISGAKRILAAHPDWSDRAVAEIAGLSAKTIGVLRNRSTGGTPSLEKRLGRDGKLHPINGAAGRKRVVEYIMAHPDASIRQIAREVDVSLGTVHDVRDRLRRGTDPMAERRGASGPHPPVRPVPDVASGRPPAASSGMRAKRHHARQLTWTEISCKITSDPAVRYTDGGRAFLRWMTRHAAATDEWREFVDAIPVHWLEDIESIAAQISEEWGRFANWVRDREESASLWSRRLRRPVERPHGRQRERSRGRPPERPGERQPERPPGRQAVRRQ